MPRKAKDEEVNKTKKVATSGKAKAPAKATSKASAKKAVSTTKKTVTKKSTTKKAVTEKTTVKKTTTKKTATKKTTTKRTTRAKKQVAPPIMEYYDLPATYNRTTVKILAQTPSCLFVYWEISDQDRISLQKQYGESFFQDTKPYLVITNETMNYTFEIEINDYANSWYIHIHDSDCKYEIKLVRKSIHSQPSFGSFIPITSSNEMDAPNDHILFDKLGKTVFFRNVKSNVVQEKDISSVSFISNIGKIYNIYDLYKEIYKNELDGDKLGIGLTSS